MGQMAQVTAGKMIGHHVKILNLQPTFSNHCHSLVAFEDQHTDVLSIIGILEVDILRALP